MANNATRSNYGPCRLYYGDPTAGSGAMVDLGVMYNVNIVVDQAVTYTSNANITGVRDHNSVRAMPSMCYVEAEMADWSKAILEAVNLNGTATGSGEAKTIGFGDRFKDIDPSTLFVLPDDDSASGVNSDYGFWLPSASASIGNFIRYGVPTRGGETQALWSVRFDANYRETDQTSPTPVSIPADFRMGFYGDPASISLSWSIS